MINVLIHFTGNEAKIKTAAEQLNFAYVKLTVMNNVYSLFVKSRDDFKVIRKNIKKQPNVTIICGWDDEGKKVVFPNSEDDFTRTKFKQRLKRKITRNINGDITEDQEIDNGVINVIYGHPKREY